MKNILILLILILLPLLGISQSSEPKSVVIINDTINYLFNQNKILTNNISNFKTKSEKGQSLLIVGSLIIITSPLISIMGGDKNISYIMLGTGFLMNINGSIILYKSYNLL